MSNPVEQILDRMLACGHHRKYRRGHRMSTLPIPMVRLSRIYQSIKWILTAFSFRTGDTGGTTELNPLNPFTNPKAYYQEGEEQPNAGQYQETGFNKPSDFENGYQAGGYPR